MEWQKLHTPMPLADHSWRVLRTTKDKSKGAIAFYIDARAVMERLDLVAGPGNWHDEYTVIQFSESYCAVECRLTVDGITKSDVGDGETSANDPRIPIKDAYSDALKRAAVKFGIGRYLYGMDTGRWFAINEFKELTPESKVEVERLLIANLKRLGSSVSVSKTPPPAEQEPDFDHNGETDAERTQRTAARTAAVNGLEWSDSWIGHTEALPQAYEWARQSGKFNHEKHLSAAWTKFMAGRDPFPKMVSLQDKADSLGLWRNYVMDHEPAQA